MWAGSCPLSHESQLRVRRNTAAGSRSPAGHYALRARPSITPGDFGKPRPALVVQSDLFLGDTSTVTVLLTTSTDRDIPMIRVQVEASAVNGLRTRSHIMVDKVMSVPVNKVGPVFGHLGDADMLRVNRALALFLGIVS